MTKSLKDHLEDIPHVRKNYVDLLRKRINDLGNRSPESTHFNIEDAMKRAEDLQSLNYEIMDYLRTQLTWLLEYCIKNKLPLADFDKGRLLFKKSSKFLAEVSKTESSGSLSDHIQGNKNARSDEKE